MAKTCNVNEKRLTNQYLTFFKSHNFKVCINPTVTVELFYI